MAKDKNGGHDSTAFRCCFLCSGVRAKPGTTRVISPTENVRQSQLITAVVVPIWRREKAGGRGGDSASPGGMVLLSDAVDVANVVFPSEGAPCLKKLEAGFMFSANLYCVVFKMHGCHSRLMIMVGDDDDGGGGKAFLLLAPSRSAPTSPRASRVPTHTGVAVVQPIKLQRTCRLRDSLSLAALLLFLRRRPSEVGLRRLQEPFFPRRSQRSNSFCRIRSALMPKKVNRNRVFAA